MSESIKNIPTSDLKAKLGALSSRRTLDVKKAKHENAAKHESHESHESHKNRGDRVELSRTSASSAKNVEPLVTWEEQNRYLQVLKQMESDPERMADIFYKLSQGKYGKEQLNCVIDTLMNEFLPDYP